MATELSADAPEPSDADASTLAPSPSFWRSVQRAQSAVHSLTAVLGPLPDPHLAFSDDPAAALLRDHAVSEAVSRRLRLPSSGAGDDQLCRWLYDTFHSAVPALRLAVRSFLPALVGAYLSRSSPSPSGPRHPLAGFEAVLLALYAHETVRRGGEPETVTLPSLAAPSIYHEVKPPSKKAAAEADELNSSSSATGPAVVSPALEPHGTVRSTRRARIVGVTLELYYSNISQMPNFSKLEFCEFCTAWSGQDATFKAQKQGSSSPASASASQRSDFQGEAKEGKKVPLPWELFQPMLRIVGHCLLGFGDSAELRTTAYKAAQCLHTRAAREIDSPTAILASRSLIRLGKIAAVETEAAATEVQEPTMEVQESAAEAKETATEAKEHSVVEMAAEAKETAAEAKEPSVAEAKETAAEAKEPSMAEAKEMAAEAKEPSVAEAKEPSVAEAKEPSVAEAKETAAEVKEPPVAETKETAAEAKEPSVAETKETAAEAKEPSLMAETKETAAEAKEPSLMAETKETASEAKEPSMAETKETASEAKEPSMAETNETAAEAKETAAEAKEPSVAETKETAVEAKESSVAEMKESKRH